VGIRWPSATHYRQSRLSATVYSARPTKHGLTSVLQQGWLDITLKTTVQNWFVRTSKSEAKVTNKKTALKSIYQMVSFPMTLHDPWAVFQKHNTLYKSIFTLHYIQRLPTWKMVQQCRWLITVMFLFARNSFELKIQKFIF